LHDARRNPGLASQSGLPQFRLLQFRFAQRQTGCAGTAHTT
jgi:hypothetical protein